MKWDVFDIIGPIMTGPSSSHTSGAVRIGLFANKLIGGIPETAKILLHGSYAEVYKGHGTDKALIAGLLGLASDSEKLVDAFSIAQENNLNYEFKHTNLGDDYHPNSAKLILKRSNQTLELVGESIGAGKIRIIEIEGIRFGGIDGSAFTIITLQQDKPGVIAEISKILSTASINIAEMTISRQQQGGKALSTITIDSNNLGQDVIDRISLSPKIIWVKTLDKIC